MSDAKKTILARRARFVAAAVASVGIACGKEKATPPQPCLEVAIQPDAGQPTPCLSVAIPQPNGDAAAPRPCLSPPVHHDSKNCQPGDPLCSE